MSDPRLQIESYSARHRAAPDSPWFMPLGAAHRAAGDLESAQRVLRAGLEHHPGHVSARVLLAQVQLEMQQEDAAEANFARVLELDPENVVALRYRAERARRRGALERAYEILRLLLEVDPFDREVQADLGLLSAALERRTRAAASEPAPPTPPAAAPAGQAAVPEEPATFSPPPAAVPEATSRLDLPWLHAIPDPVATPEAPAGALEPPPIDLERVQRGGATGARPGVDRGPFAPRTPEMPPVPESKESPPRPGESAAPFERAPGSEWTWTRSDDRIVVTPGEPPVRGPIRSVEQRVWGSQEATPVAPIPPVPPSIPKPPAPAAPAPPTGADSSDAFSTLTLARIYESQGYLEKALAIYDDLHRRFPQEAEIASQLSALQRRLAGVAEVLPSSPPRGVPAPTPPAADAAVTWRLVDPATANPGPTTERLRQATTEVRDRERERHHTVIGVPPNPPASPPAPPDPAGVTPPLEDVSRGHADFERFLHYVRSLKP